MTNLIFFAHTQSDRYEFERFVGSEFGFEYDPEADYFALTLCEDEVDVMLEVVERFLGDCGIRGRLEVQ